MGFRCSNNNVQNEFLTKTKFSCDDVDLRQFKEFKVSIEKDQVLLVVQRSMKILEKVNEMARDRRQEPYLNFGG